MEYNINLKVYEGPMELLLDLIKKNEIDIYDIPIRLITSEFLSYINNAKEINLELTSDFLVMASTLVEIKSKMLLPKLKLENSEEEQEKDPRQTLIDKILEYEQYKKISEKLRESEKYESKAFYKLQEDFSNISDLSVLKNCNTDNLCRAFRNILNRTNDDNIISTISVELFSIEKANNIILDILEDKDRFLFSSLLGNYTILSEVISYFLALLELIKIGTVDARQTENYLDIEIIRR